MRSAFATGVSLAAASAVAFGITTPAIAWASTTTGPLTTAAILYVGAAAAALAMKRAQRVRGGSALRSSDAPRIIAIGVAGAAIAPFCLAWGIARSGATAGSLVLNLEAVLTVVLAWLFYREPLGRRVVGAVVLMAIAGAFLALDAAARSHTGLLGALVVGAATLGWAVDNTLTRGLAERDPLAVIVAKGSVGAALTTTLALLVGESRPSAAAVGLLALCGATGYGLSLRLYLLAQREIGAARTGSVFALAPFIGAGIAWLLGDRNVSLLTGLAAVGFGVGVYLHISEHHEHEHEHPAVEHEHAHRHDDRHHAHTHEPPVLGEHTHVHTHDRVIHAHDHAPDIHHDHAH